jgi:hypothetical protein
MAKRKVRVRSKRLAQLDDSKLALAVWLIARDLVQDETSLPPDAPREDALPPSGEETA